MNPKLPEDKSIIDSTFITLLTQHRGGEALNELGQAIRTITDAALLTGQPGVITLKLMIDPTKSGAIEVYDDQKVTMPKAEKVGSLFFVGEGGALVRNNPNQLEMPLRSIEGGAVADVNSLRQVSQ